MAGRALKNTPGAGCHPACSFFCCWCNEPVPLGEIAVSHGDGERVCYGCHSELLELQDQLCDRLAEDFRRAQRQKALAKITSEGVTNGHGS